MRSKQPPWNTLGELLYEWYWNHGGNTLAYARLFLWMHGKAWAERHRHLRDSASIENLQRAFAIVSLLIGIVLCCGQVSPRSSQFEIEIQSNFPGEWHWISVRHIFGLVMLTGSLSVIVSVMEWPCIVELEESADNEFERNRLRLLAQMQFIGTLFAGSYWVASFLITLSPLDSPIRIAPWFALAMAYLHYWLSQRILKLYVQARFRSGRAREDRRLLAERAQRRSEAPGGPLTA